MADQAKRDQNRVPTLLGVDSIGFAAPTTAAVNPSTHAMLVEGSFTPPAGGATSDNQTNGSQKTQIVDAGGDAATVTGGKLDVNASIDTTGLATSAKQDTGNTSLSSIDGKTPALGQALAAASSPVVLTAAQITTLTPLSSVTANAGTNLNTSLLALESGGNLAALAGAVTASVVQANTKQINGVTVLMGNGGTGTGSQRVTIASDNSAITGMGAGATGAAVPANAIYKGGNAATALPSAATAGNLTGVMMDKFGRQVMLPGTVRDLVGTQTTTISASTAETTIVTAAASVFNDIILLTVANTSGTGVRVDLRDTTAGSVIASLWVPATDTRGFSLGEILPQTTVNTNWTITSSASVTDLRIFAIYNKNK